MNKLISKIVGVCLGLSLATGVGAGLALNHHEFKEANASGSGDWTEVTSVADLNATDKYIIANNADKGYYFNGAQSSGHFQTTAFSSSNPASDSAAGVFTLEFVGLNTWKIKLVSTSKYVTASKASSGSGVVNSSSDTSGWKFYYDGGFNAIYQKAYDSKYATLRCYNNTSFRTYQNVNANTVTTSSGTVFKIYKYGSSPVLADYTLTFYNSPFTSTSSSNTGTEDVTVNSIAYTNYAGYKFDSQKVLSFNKGVNGYLGNKTIYSKYIDSIVIGFTSAVSGNVTLYKGSSTLAETTPVTPSLSNSNLVATYDLGGDSSFFKLKLTTTGDYVNISYIAIYLSDSVAPQPEYMTIVDSTISEGPFSMRFGSYGGLLLYAHDGTEAISSGVTWSVGDSDIIDLDDDFADNHCWVKPATEVGETTVTAEKEGYITAVATISVIKGDLEQIAVSGSMTTTAYALNSDWDPTGLAVTAVYETGYSDDVTDDATWTFSPAIANSLSITSVVATASYTEDGITKTKSSDAQTVSVFAGATYDLRTIEGFSGWGNGYGSHSLNQNSFDPDVSIAASLNFLITNKQADGVGSTYPCIGAKTSTETTCLTFTLNESGYKITTVSITFVTRYTKTYPSLYLHKGEGVGSDAIDTLTMSGDAGDEDILSCSNLNDTVFTIGYNAHQTGSNGAVGIKSITIGLADADAFGTVDHIKVTSLPRTTYHYGEVYDSTGLVVTAYDGADESTANFKDVTDDINTRFTSGIYTFDDADIPTTSMWVSYTESGSTYYADDITFRVYPVATYELVTDDEPFDWSGEYLIVGAHTVDEVTTYYAMDGSLENPDVDGGHQTVTVDTYTIEAGQELAWKITPVTGGYSIQGSSGKYIGSLAAKNNGMLVSDTPVVNELSLDGVNTTITGTNGYHLKFNPDANGRFRYYSSGTVQLYKLVDSTDAFGFADEFLDMLSSGSEAVCDLDGNTDLDDLKVAWAILAYDYSLLDASDKEQFRLGIANEGGTLVQQTLALYDYITEKYGSDLESEDCDNYNFMNRAALSGANPRISPVNGGNSAVTMAIIVVAALTVTTAGAYFFLRKKKEEK